MAHLAGCYLTTTGMERRITIEITPDDSVEANSQKTITIQGKDGELQSVQQM